MAPPSRAWTGRGGPATTLVVPLLVAAVATGCTGKEPEPTQPRGRARDRDVILVTLDTTRHDHLGCYGYDRETSPTIDAFAASGTRFERAYAATPVTLPSHASILTGLDPPRHGVRNNGTYALPPEAHTLAEAMKEQGRTTAAFVSAFVLDRRFGLDQGFDHYDDDVSGGGPATSFTIDSRDAPATVDAALAWLDGRPAGERLFVWLHLFDPHAPYKRTPEREKMFGDATRDLYDAEIWTMDAELGRFRDALSALGRGAAVWIILADHGEGLMQEHGDHNEAAHGVFLYEETVRIPLIFSGEGLFPAAVSRTRARQTDVLPTLLELLGMDVPEDLDGASLLDAIDGEKDREVYLESLLPLEDYGWSPMYGLVQDDWKYVQAPLPELYALDEDPRELDNLHDRQPARAEAMSRALQPLVARQGQPAPRISLDGASLDRLRALGYVAAGAIGDEGDELPDPKLMMQTSFNIPYELDRAGTLFTKGRPAAACDILERIVERNPANGEALKLLGWEPLRAVRDARVRQQVHPQRDRLLRASRHAFEMLREHAPELPDGEFGLGQIRQLENDLDGALAHYEKVLASHPDYVNALEAAMMVRGARRDLDIFTEYAERLLAIDPTHFQANFQLGNLRKSRGDCRAALEHYQAIAEGQGDRSAVHLYMGDCYRALDDCPRALESYRRVTHPGLREQYDVDSLEASCEDRP